MRLLIFWDSISEWYWDLENAGWANRLKIYFWKQKINMEVGISAIAWDEVPDILKRFDITSKAFLEKYNEDVIFLFAIWINDSVTNIDKTKNRYSKNDFKENLEKVIQKSQKFSPKKIIFLWLTNVDEKLVAPAKFSSSWKCYFNDRIQEFNSVIKEIAENNNCDFIEIFGLLDNIDLADWLHPNSKWHQKIFEKVKEYFN